MTEEIDTLDKSIDETREKLQTAIRKKMAEDYAKHMIQSVRRAKQQYVLDLLRPHFENTEVVALYEQMGHQEGVTPRAAFGAAVKEAENSFMMGKEQKDPE